MITHRTPKDAGHTFTRISNEAIRDRRLSLKARGLLAQILSMSENWGLSVSGMLSFQKLDGEDSVRAAWRELEAAGYLRKRERGRDGHGRLLPVEYEVFEKPQGDDGSPHAGLPHVDKPRVAEPRVGNQALRTTNAYAKNEQGCSTTYAIELEGSSSTFEKEGDRPAKGEAQARAGFDAVGTLTGDMLKRCRDAVDIAMARNIELAKGSFWCKLDERVRKHRAFNDVFGQYPHIAWTREEDDYLSEIASFCRERLPEADIAERVGTLVRGAFRRGVKVHQVLRHWVEHCGCRISLRPFLTLAGGGKDPGKRHDFLIEVAATMDDYGREDVTTNTAEVPALSAGVHDA